jgi:pimeloyl-ACP methyl ester carboxylesterase
VKLLLGIALMFGVGAFVAGCGEDGDGNVAPTAAGDSRPLPEPVDYRQTPEGVTLADPAFEPVPGASADFGQLGGSVYQIEMPDDWDGRLVLYAHGYGEEGPVASVAPPDNRRYLIGHGIAWGASSFSSNSFIPGRAADETAALWDYFALTYGRPKRTYITGESMGGLATHIAAERYPDRFDGGLAFCGAAGASSGIVAQTDYFVTAAYVAGVTQAEFDARNDNHRFVTDSIRAALDDPTAHERWVNLMIDLSGGPRAFATEGFLLEEETNWLRAEQQVTIGLARNTSRDYQMNALSGVDSEEFNRSAIRIPGNEGVIANWTRGNDATGDLKIPLMTMHTTGDWQVPIGQAKALRELVEEAGKGDMLVQRVIRDPNHCGFTGLEWDEAFEALFAWVEDGVKPEGHDLLVADLQTLSAEFELQPREGTPEADSLPAAADRAVIRGLLTLDGKPFDARWVGAVVRSEDGLITPCQHELPPVQDGRYEITVFADSESRGCGVDGAEVFLWTYTNAKLFSSEGVAWPGDGGAADFATGFSTRDPWGGAGPTTELGGGVYDAEGGLLPAGAIVEAYVGDVRCGVASVRGGSSFFGYILAVIGPEAVPGCEAGATLNFRVDGQPVVETATNTLDGGDGPAFDLTVE